MWTLCLSVRSHSLFQLLRKYHLTVIKIFFACSSWSIDGEFLADVTERLIINWKISCIVRRSSSFKLWDNSTNVEITLKVCKKTKFLFISLNNLQRLLMYNTSWFKYQIRFTDVTLQISQQFLIPKSRNITTGKLTTLKYQILNSPHCRSRQGFWTLN